MVKGSSRPAPFVGAMGAGAGGAAAPGELHAAMRIPTASGAKKRRRFMSFLGVSNRASPHLDKSGCDSFSGLQELDIRGAAWEHAAKVRSLSDRRLPHRFGEPLQRVAHGGVRHDGRGALLQDVAV